MGIKTLSETIYIAGPMTGLPNFNFHAFFDAEEELQAQGWSTVNPAAHDLETDSVYFDPGAGAYQAAPDFDLTVTLLWDLEQVAHADAIYLLVGWQGSKGANAEYALAKALGKKIIYQPDEDKYEVAVGSDGEVRTTSSTGGQKGVKLARFDLIPADALEQVAEHYGRGAAKYDDNQWRKGYEWSKSFAALLRHAFKWQGGQDYDPETGSHEMACVAWHALALLTFAKDFPEFDDRYKLR